MRNELKKTLIASALMLCSVPMFAQEKPKLEEEDIAPPRKLSMKQALSGKIFPSSYLMKDLNSDWHVFNLSENGSTLSLSVLFGLYSGILGEGINSYFTKGEEVIIGSETFLVSYHAKMKTLSQAQLNGGGPNPEVLESFRMKEDSPITLTLVNLRMSGTISNIRSFDLKEMLAQGEVAQKAVSVAPEEPKGPASTGNLKQLTAAVASYAQDKDEVLPPMDSYATFKESLLPYVKGQDAFVNPLTKEPYELNSILTKHKLAHIKNKSEMAVIFESAPGADGTRGVGFLDGHVARVTETEWTLIKKQSKIK